MSADGLTAEDLRTLKRLWLDLATKVEEVGPDGIWAINRAVQQFLRKAFVAGRDAGLAQGLEVAAAFEVDEPWYVAVPDDQVDLDARFRPTNWEET
jgi:hypothetical protein